VIEVTHFAPLDDVDPIYYERTCWLAPDGEGSEVEQVPDRRAKPDPKMLSMATQLVDSLTGSSTSTTASAPPGRRSAGRR
jgi:non-homologous end joining protein Ku